MASRTRREQQAAARRQQLLDTALALFAERGFEHTSLKDLGAAVGVAPGLVYHYFRSKDDLLLAVLDQPRFRPELHRLLTVVPERPAAAVLAEVARGFAAVVATHEPLLRIMLREMQTNPRVAAAIQERGEEAIALLAGYLDARIRAGEVRPHDTRVTARTLFSQVILLHLTRTPSDAFLPVFIDILLHGIVAP
jgi:AcrR family transcriptional regulator